METINYALLNSDHALSADELDAKYNSSGYGEHPEFTRQNWRSEVDADNTLQGYWSWVQHEIDVVVSDPSL